MADQLTVVNTDLLLPPAGPDLSVSFRLRCVGVLSPPGCDPDRVGSSCSGLVPPDGDAAEPPLSAADEDSHSGQSDDAVLRPDSGPGGAIGAVLQVGGGGRALDVLDLLSVPV